MDRRDELAALARAIIDANVYMTLGTADGTGLPWVNPVYFAATDYRDFYWISSPDTAHSRNLRVRPQLSIVVFDSTIAVGTGQAVYMFATATEVSADAELDQALTVYPGSSRGGRALTRDEVAAPSPYRMYRATASQHWVLCPRDPRPCAEHGLAYDHRTTVDL